MFKRGFPRFKSLAQADGPSGAIRQQADMRAFKTRSPSALFDFFI